MPIELDRLFQDLDTDQLRFRWPSKFVFFCGGAIPDTGDSVSSLRKYLLKAGRISSRVKAEIVLAEAANQLWRTTTYPDLITFEEDIAKIAAMVLVIAESPGALAELGAFSANATIRSSLSVIIQEKFANDESFVRLGPVERIYKDDPERVAFFPWVTRKNGDLIKKTVRPHVRNIISFLNKQLKRIPASARLSLYPDLKDFVLLYWVIHLSQAIPLNKLTTYSSSLIPNLDPHKVRRMLYCMQIAGWIGNTHYSNVDYYYARLDADPLIYRFRPQLQKKVRDAVRRRTEVITIIHGDLALPKHIKQVAIKARRAASK